jgi:hypothetical protein
MTIGVHARNQRTLLGNNAGALSDVLLGQLHVLVEHGAVHRDSGA